MKKLIDFPEKIMDTIKFIQGQKGLKTFTGTLFDIIANYYQDNYFSKYKVPSVTYVTQGGEKVVQKEELTDEQKCELLGGTMIDVDDGLGGKVKKCKIKVHEGASRTIPTNLLNSYLKDKKLGK